MPKCANCTYETPKPLKDCPRCEGPLTGQSSVSVVDSPTRGTKKKKKAK